MEPSGENSFGERGPRRFLAAFVRATEIHCPHLCGSKIHPNNTTRIPDSWTESPPVSTSKNGPNDRRRETH